jgi:hypothetical protein
MEMVTKTDGYGFEVLVEPFTAYGITVPAGFSFDGASAPRIFWPIIPPLKGTKKAACVHDWLCMNAKSAMERHVADLLFYMMLLEAGLGLVRSFFGYLGVRIGAFFGIGVRYKHWTRLWRRNERSGN